MGRLRDLDPTMVTAALISTVLMHRGVSRLIVGEQQIYTDSREAGRAYTKFWLDVLSAAQNVPACQGGTAPAATTS
jgi:hypothetical protein